MSSRLRTTPRRISLLTCEREHRGELHRLRQLGHRRRRRFTVGGRRDASCPARPEPDEGGPDGPAGLRANQQRVDSGMPGLVDRPCGAQSGPICLVGLEFSVVVGWCNGFGGAVDADPCSHACRQTRASHLRPEAVRARPQIHPPDRHSTFLCHKSNYLIFLRKTPLAGAKPPLPVRLASIGCVGYCRVNGGCLPANIKPT